MLTQHHAKVWIDRETIDWLNGLLKGAESCYVKDAETIWYETAKFDDGYFADVKLVSGGRTGEPDADLPYVDAVLFDMHGAEAYCMGADCEKIDGEYRFEDAGHDYTLEIVVADDKPAV